jgi:hypothetical protein
MGKNAWLDWQNSVLETQFGIVPRHCVGKHVNRPSEKIIIVVWTRLISMKTKFWKIVVLSASTVFLDKNVWLEWQNSVLFGKTTGFSAQALFMKTCQPTV